MKRSSVSYHLLFTVFLLATVAIATAISSQATSDLRPVFEVASIKAVPRQDIRAKVLSGNIPGVMTVNGARVDFGLVALYQLVMIAYRIKQSHQIVAPEWLRDQVFEIHATLPKGATKDQVPEMIQALLAERFKLLAHRENRSQPVYALIVSKGGPKLKRALDDATFPANDPTKTPSGPSDTGQASDKTLRPTNKPEEPVSIKKEQGKTEIAVNGPRGKFRSSIDENGIVHTEYSKITMADLAVLLTPMMDRPVLDMTNLKGSYQVTLELSRQALTNLMRSMRAPDPELGPVAGSSGATSGSVAGTSGPADIAAPAFSDGGVFRAIQQLGLKLEARKVLIETLIIDQIEKNPTEN